MILEVRYITSDMISEVGYTISEFQYDMTHKNCVTTSYGFLTQMAPHTAALLCHCVIVNK